MIDLLAEQVRSLPSRERGLKFAGLASELVFDGSLPSRERGLKFNKLLMKTGERLVAPFTGAWIEILLSTSSPYRSPVAPFTGAWIEIKRP